MKGVVSVSHCGGVTESEGPAARRSKANEEPRLVERKVCFILEAGDQGGGWTPVQRPTPPTDSQGARASIDGGSRLRAETAPSDGHLEIGHWWSDQCHLDCFKYSESSVPGSVCSHFLEASSRNCGSLCHGYSLVIMLLTSST